MADLVDRNAIDIKKHRAPSKSTRLVLASLLTGPQYGYAIMKETGLKSGTLYPILMRLTERQFLISQWQARQESGRPARQTYELTAKGHEYAKDTALPETLNNFSIGNAT